MNTFFCLLNILYNKNIMRGGWIMNRTYATLNMKKLQLKPSRNISSKEALKDVERINWSKDVINGRRKVTVTGAKEK
jgi:hypothetical protein